MSNAVSEKMADLAELGSASKIGRTRAFFNRPRRAYADPSPLLLHTYEETVRRIPPGNAASTAVDLGCQWGRFTQVLAQTYGNVIGVDFADEALSTALPAPNIQYVRLDLNIEGAELGGFAPVHCFLAIALMEMVVEPETLCQQMASAAAPGGRLLAYIPNRRSLNYISLRCALWIARVILGRRDRYIHHNGITIERLKQYLSACGFATEEEGSMSGIPLYLGYRLPHSWQRVLLRFEPWVKHCFGGSYHWILCRKS